MSKQETLDRLGAMAQAEQFKGDGKSISWIKRIERQLARNLISPSQAARAIKQQLNTDL